MYHLLQGRTHLVEYNCGHPANLDDLLYNSAYTPNNQSVSFDYSFNLKYQFA